MKKGYFLIIMTWFSLISLISSAQINQGGEPFSFQNPQLVKDLQVFEIMPAVDVAARMAEDSVNDTFKDIPWRFGENFEVSYNLTNSGSWDIFPSGDRIWRLGIRCPGALTINLAFDNYHLPPGASLFVYNTDKTHVIGAFTDFNNQADRAFATTLVNGGEIIIEYYEPANPAFPGELNLSRVTHGYRDVFRYVKSFGESGSCNNNVNCPEAAGWEYQVRSACMLVSGGNGFCSGALVNNTSQDGTPYVLTANHCYSDPSTWVFWFNWQSPTCANPPTSPPYDAISGATLKARYTDSDFCLVQMNSTAPVSYNVYYSGWNRENVAATSGAGIHHPSGDIKKISYSILPYTSDTYTGTPADSHWKVIWNDGVTEPGSSGSPIFDQNHRIVGQLHGGPSSCSASQLWDFYGKFSMSWAQGTTAATRLKDWLDPTNLGNLILDGFDPNLPLPAVVTLPATSVTLSAATLNGTVNPSGYATTYHFDWGTSVSYGNVTSTQSAGAGNTALTVNAGITGLTAGITYHFRLSATNSYGTSTGVDLTFTPGAATVITAAATAITATSATSGGNVVTDGGTSVTARGVCWSTTANPTLSDSHTTDGSGVGTFISYITGLSANTTYHVRAYATNGSGTYYGNDLQFVSACGIISTLPFNEGFETSATRPSCWTEENSNPAWQFITGNGGSNPANAHTGVRNACLKDNNAASNLNKLITPVFNLTGYTNVQLTFWLYMQIWVSDQDELTVYYRTSATGSWILLQNYNTNINVWTQKTISLPVVSAEFQLAFEGNAKYGYGVCIDDIQITGTGGGVTLIVSPPSQSVSPSAGTTPFSVTCPIAWTATSNATWCVPTPSGTGNGTITASYEANTSVNPRTAIITVSATGATTQTVSVIQSGISPTLNVTPSNQNVTPPAGSTSFSVTSNTNWTVTSDATWCTPTLSGSGNGTISAVYLENTTAITRIATLTVSVTGLTPLTVTVTQAGAAPILNVIPPNQNVTAPGGFTTFTVTSNSNWTVTSNMAWCVPTPSGSGNGFIDAVYEENTSVNSRIATLTVTISGLSPVAVTVTQAGAAPILAVQPPNQDVASIAGTTDFTVTSNTNWTAGSDVTWCIVTPSGTGNGTIMANYTENTTHVDRIANISVTVSGLSPQVVTVTQAASTVSTGGHVNEEIQIFPNPTQGLFEITTGKTEQQSLEVNILDCTGKIILTRNCSGNKHYSFDLSTTPKGCYFVKIRTDSGLLIRKLVIL